MNDLFLIVSSLGTDREGEALRYQVRVDDHVLDGTFEGKTGSEYRRHIGEAPATAQVTLLSPDARLRLVVLPKEG